MGGGGGVTGKQTRINCSTELDFFLLLPCPILALRIKRTYVCVVRTIYVDFSNLSLPHCVSLGKQRNVVGTQKEAKKGYVFKNYT